MAHRLSGCGAPMLAFTVRSRFVVRWNWTDKLTTVNVRLVHLMRDATLSNRKSFPHYYSEPSRSFTDYFWAKTMSSMETFLCPLLLLAHIEHTCEERTTKQSEVQCTMVTKNLCLDQAIPGRDKMKPCSMTRITQNRESFH